MTYERIMPVFRFHYLDGETPPVVTPANHGKRLIAAVDAFVRRTGWSHIKLAEFSGVEPARITMLLNNDWPMDWIDIATRLDMMLASESERERRESRMPVMTRTVKSTLGLVNVLLEDGGIGLIQGDSGVGKTEALQAVALRFPRSISTLATVCRARPKPMLEDLAARMHVSAYGRSLDEVYRQVVEAMPRRCDLVIIDEAHRYIGRPDCIHALTDVLKETNVPQLWTATGDLMRYLARRGPKGDPFAQVRSRIVHQLDLNALRERGHALAEADDIAELASRKFDLKLDNASREELKVLAGEVDGGGLRRIETILKEARRCIAGGLSSRDAIRRAIDKKAASRIVRPARPIVARVQEAKRATA